MTQPLNEKAVEAALLAMQSHRPFYVSDEAVRSMLTAAAQVRARQGGKS